MAEPRVRNLQLIGDPQDLRPRDEQYKPADYGRGHECRLQKPELRPQQRPQQQRDAQQAIC